MIEDRCVSAADSFHVSWKASHGKSKTRNDHQPNRTKTPNNRTTQPLTLTEVTLLSQTKSNVSPNVVRWGLKLLDSEEDWEGGSSVHVRAWAQALFSFEETTDGCKGLSHILFSCHLSYNQVWWENIDYLLNDWLTPSFMVQKLRKKHTCSEKNIKCCFFAS